MDRVNSRLPGSEQFQPWWWGLFKRARLYGEYRRHFPDGKDVNKIYRMGFIMFGALVGLAIALRFL